MFHKVHERPDHVDDIVHQRAKNLRISTQEVFSRAYVEGGLDASDAIIPFKAYNLQSGSGVIPEIVQEFCAKPLPTCENPNCPHPGSVGKFTRTTEHGTHTFYFCSVECLDATIGMSLAVANSDEGMEILERVRSAMSKSVYCEVDPALMRPLEGQPRVYFNAESMRGLTLSLKSVGQVQPGIIRRIPTDAEGKEYEILDGERRWRGVVEADIPHYRAMMIDIDDQAASFVVSIITNFNRQEHTLLEVVDSVTKMHEQLRIKIGKIADIMGLHPVQVTQLYGLRRLPPEVRDMLDPNMTPKDKLLSKTAAIKISAMAGGPAAKVAMAHKIREEGLTIEGLNRHLQGSGGGGGRVRGPLETRVTVTQKAIRIAALLGDLKVLLHSEAGRRAFTGELNPSEVEVPHERLHTARVLVSECIDLLPRIKTT